MKTLRKVLKRTLFLGELIGTVILMVLVVPVWIAVELLSVIARPLRKMSSDAEAS